MNQNFQQKTDHDNVNVNLMGGNVIQIKSGITINLDVSVQNFICVKKNIFSIFGIHLKLYNPATCSCKHEKNQQILFMIW